MARFKRKSEPTKFDAEQLAAIAAFTGAHRVDACAGAGKTAALVARVKHLQQRGVPIQDILALTFTRSAAEEMRLRTGAEKETLRTLHSWALSVVKQEVSEFNQPLQSFPLLTNQFEVLLPISKKLGVQYKDLTSYISNAKRMGKTPNTMREESETEMQRAFAKAYEQYEYICRRNGVLDFDSIIWELVKLFEKKPAVAERHGIKFLMVDEAQDCSEMDWRLICLITKRHGNIWAVGDFAQSIYGFRGSSRIYSHPLAACSRAPGHCRWERTIVRRPTSWTTQEGHAGRDGLPRQLEGSQARHEPAGVPPVRERRGRGWLDTRPCGAGSV